MEPSTFKRFLSIGVDMKIPLNPPSLLAGLSLLGVVALATGAAQTPAPTRTVFVGETPPEWWTYAELNPSQPQGYTVSQGRRLVVTMCWTSGNRLFADGQDVTGRFLGVLGNPSTTAQFGNGTRLVFEPGSLLTTTGSGIVQLWGYLAPTR